MRKTGTLAFGLFVIVVLGAIYMLMQRSGRASLGLVAVLVGILVLRVVLFVVNLRQQRRNAERGKGPVRIETRLGIEDETEPRDAKPPATPEP